MHAWSCHQGMTHSKGALALMWCNISTLTSGLNGRAKRFSGWRVLLLPAIWPPPFKQLSIFSFRSTQSLHHTEKEALRYHIAHHFYFAVTAAHRNLPEHKKHCQRGGICSRTHSFYAGFDSNKKICDTDNAYGNSFKNKNNLHARKAWGLRYFRIRLYHVVCS